MPTGVFDSFVSCIGRTQADVPLCLTTRRLLLKKKHFFLLHVVVTDAPSAAAVATGSLIVKFCLGRGGEKKRKESKSSYRLSVSLFLLQPGAYEGVELNLGCTVAARGERCVRFQCTSYGLIAPIL